MERLKVDLTACRILIVDDTPVNLEVLIDMLESEGFDIGIARDGSEALEVVGMRKPDLILLDVMMPGIDGYETCRRLKAQEEFEEIPVIFLTARADPEGTLEGFAAGGVDYVTKPFQKEELLARIHTNLERAILARDLLSLNEELEHKVRERTRELHLRVSELEGKDRITQHMLVMHSLEETLAVVLDVVTNITGVDQAVIYTKSVDEWTAVAATGLVGEELGDRPARDGVEGERWRQALSQVERGCLALNTAIELGPHDTKVSALLQGHHARVSALLSETIERGQLIGEIRSDLTGEQVAKALFVFSAGLLGASKVLSDTIDTAEMLESALAMVTPG
jgi:DNA-binding response OmpR family regulator